MPTTLALTTRRVYQSEFEATLTTLKTPAQIAKFVRNEVRKERNRLVRSSPVSSGLLKRSWNSEVSVRGITPPNKPNGGGVPTVGLLNKPLRLLLPATVAASLPPAVKRTSIVKLGGVGKLTTVKSIIGALKVIVPQLTITVAVAVTVATILKIVKQVKQRSNRVRVYFKINNFAPNSYYRIVGRPAGKAPPTKRLVDWAKRRGLPESAGYAIAKKIAAQGTDRYRTGQNIVYINPTTRNYRADAPFIKLIDRVLAYL